MHVNKLDSILFWKEWSTLHPEKVSGFKFSNKIPQGRMYQSYMQLAKVNICPICQDARSYEITYKGVTREIYCLCAILRWIDRKSTDLGEFETPVQKASLDDLKPVPLPGPEAAKDLQELLTHVKSWMENPTRWMLIQGGTGTAKSHILWALKTELPYLITYISAERFQSHLFAMRNTEDGVQRLIDSLSFAPILFFDDWGIEHNSSWTTDSLAAIINRRYASPLEHPTVITTNLAIGELIESPDVAIRRITSRMIDQQYSDVFRLRQADMRNPKTHQALEKAGSR